MPPELTAGLPSPASPGARLQRVCRLCRAAHVSKGFASPASPLVERLRGPSAVQACVNDTGSGQASATVVVAAPSTDYVESYNCDPASVSPMHSPPRILRAGAAGRTYAVATSHTVRSLLLMLTLHAAADAAARDARRL